MFKTMARATRNGLTATVMLLWFACVAASCSANQSTAPAQAKTGGAAVAGERNAGETPRPQDEPNAPPTQEPPSYVPPPLSEYMGRTIAVTMSYHGAPWLIRNEREQEERCSLLLANLDLRRGMTVCDLGCGNGFYTLPIARLLGEKGRVLAVDIQPEMLNLLRESTDREGIDNITPILGSVHDPRLPRESIDLVLLVDVYHEFSHPQQMLARIRDALKPDGKVALVEFRGEDETVPIKAEHKMSKAQILKEFPANGFTLVKEFDKLPWQHVMFFEKSAEVTESPQDPAPDKAPR